VSGVLRCTGRHLFRLQYTNCNGKKHRSTTMIAFGSLYRLQLRVYSNATPLELFAVQQTGQYRIVLRVFEVAFSLLDAAQSLNFKLVRRLHITYLNI